MARIAYLSSDTVISVQASLQADSQFSKTLNGLRASNTHGIVSKESVEVY